MFIYFLGKKKKNMKKSDRRISVKYSILKCSIVLILSLHIMPLPAQPKCIKIDASFGLSYPKNVIPNGFGLGVLTAIEPKFDIHYFSVGTRVGFNILRASPNVNFLAENQIDKFDMSLLLTGDCYLTKGKFRPFIGIGAGLFLLSATSGYDITSESGNWKSYGAKFGGLGRCGIEMPYVRISLCYTYVGGMKKNSYGYINFDYISLTVSGWVRIKKYEDKTRIREEND